MLARNWYYANQKSDLILKATEYNIKPRMIAMVAANPFRGVKTEIHIGTLSVSQCYATWCNKKEFPSIWYKWNHFPYSLADKAEDQERPDGRWMTAPQ
jgi:hypothetical protein